MTRLPKACSVIFHITIKKGRKTTLPSAPVFCFFQRETETSLPWERSVPGLGRNAEFGRHETGGDDVDDLDHIELGFLISLHIQSLL